VIASLYLIILKGATYYFSGLLLVPIPETIFWVEEIFMGSLSGILLLGRPTT
jgi:hypothetical protein